METTGADVVVHELLQTPEGRRNPYPLYHRLRDLAPVHRTRWGTWFLTRYRDCAAALRDPRLGKDYATQMERTVGPDWRRLRYLVASRSARRGHEPQVDRRVLRRPSR
jgi:cytochrome P450